MKGDIDVRTLKIVYAALAATLAAGALPVLPPAPAVAVPVQSPPGVDDGTAALLQAADERASVRARVSGTLVEVAERTTP